MSRAAIAAAFAATTAALLACTSFGTSSSDAPDGGSSDAATVDGSPAPDGGEGGGADAGCPSAHGPPMIAVALAAGGAVCVDATEVTMQQYQEFLDSTPDVAAQPALCRGSDGGTVGFDNASFASSCPGPPSPTSPIACVDWCDAYAYCAWAGKRLCKIAGAVSGVTLRPAATDDGNEWYLACSHGGTRALPFGSGDAGVCNFGDASAPVASSAGCEGGYAGLFDMLGNLREWVDDCNASGFCSQRGGAYGDDPTKAGCALPSATGALRAEADSHDGFRCCADGS